MPTWQTSKNASGWDRNGAPRRPEDIKPSKESRMSTGRSDDLARYRANWQEEIDSAARYLAMAEAERDAGRAQVYRDLAAMEDKHAGFWEKRLTQAGVAVGPRRLSTRARILIWLARRLGPEAILATVASDEQAGRTGYDSQPETSGTR